MNAMRTRCSHHCPIATKTAIRNLTVLLAFLCCSTPLFAQAPNLINFQMQLADGGALPASLPVTFRIYNTATGGSALWTENQTVQQTNGALNVLLGSVTAFPATLFSGQGERYLDVVINGQSVGARFRLSSAPYALRADAADKTGPGGITFPDGTTQTTAATSGGGNSADNDWTISGNNMFSAVSGNVGIGTTSPTAPLSLGQARGNSKLALWDNGTRRMGFGVQDSEFRFHIPSPTNHFSFFDAEDGNELFRIQGDGNVGIGTTSPSPGFKLDVNGGILSRDTNQAYYFLARRQNNSVAFGATRDGLIIDNIVYIGAGTGGSELVNINGAGKGIELGAGVPGKQFDAGKILYQKYTPNALELVGAGSQPSGLDRRIQMWAEAGLTVIGSITATGSITPGSSRAFKKDITDLSLEEALSALADLNPVKYRYKDEANGDLHLGFIAEDVPELVAIPSRKGVDPSDIVALLTKVVQQQQQQIQALEARLDAQR